MTPKEFCYWLQGFFEMADPKELTPEQIEMVKKHLALVFTNVTNPPISKKDLGDLEDMLRGVRPLGIDYPHTPGLHVFC